MADGNQKIEKQVNTMGTGTAVQKSQVQHLQKKIRKDTPSVSQAVIRHVGKRMAVKVAKTASGAVKKGGSAAISQISDENCIGGLQVQKKEDAASVAKENLQVVKQTEQRVRHTTVSVARIPEKIYRLQKVQKKITGVRKKGNNQATPTQPTQIGSGSASGTGEGKRRTSASETTNLNVYGASQSKPRTDKIAKVIPESDKMTRTVESDQRIVQKKIGQAAVEKKKATVSVSVNGNKSKIKKTGVSDINYGKRSRLATQTRQNAERAVIRSLEKNSMSNAKKTVKKASGTSARVAKVGARTVTGSTKATAKVAKAATGVAGTAVKAGVVTAKTGVSAAAAAGTGGVTVAAKVATMPAGLSRRLAEIIMQRRANHPLHRIFGGAMDKKGLLDVGSENPAASWIVKKLLGIVLMPLGILLSALAVIGLVGGVIILLLGALLSPLRYIYLSGEELASWNAAIGSYVSEDNTFTFDLDGTAQLQELYQQRMDDLHSQAKEAGCTRIATEYHEESQTGSNYNAVMACFWGLLLQDGLADRDSIRSADAEDTENLFLTPAAQELYRNVLKQMCKVAINPTTHTATIKLLTCEEYISASGCSEQTADAIRAIYAGSALPSPLTAPETEEIPDDIERYCAGLTHLPGVQGAVIQSALAKRGTPYSQTYRDSGQYYDCSSFVYYSYKSAGISMVYGGATTAAAEAQYCEAHGQLLAIDDLQPGDLLFYSYVQNGRYKNISHVEMYLGSGLVIDCTENPGVSIRSFTTDRLVLCGRPY